MDTKNDPVLFLLDANACNALQKIDELNQLENLANVGIINIMYTETTWCEAAFGSQIRHYKVSQFDWNGLSEDYENNRLQQPWREQIGRLIFPYGTRTDGQRRDIEALLTVKMSGGYFITRDGGSKSQPGGILGHKSQLATLGIEVLDFTDALTYALKVFSNSKANRN